MSPSPLKKLKEKEAEVAEDTDMIDLPDTFAPMVAFLHEVQQIDISLMHSLIHSLTHSFVRSLAH